MSKTIILVPAYGRDYQTEKEAIAAFQNGKDWRIADVSCKWNGCYASIRDFSGYQVKLRFKRLEEFVFVNVP